MKSGKNRKEMSSFDLMMLGNELAGLAGGRVQKVFQKGKQIRIEIFVGGRGTRELFFEPGKLFITQFKREASNEMFSQYLRRHLSGQRIVSVKQAGFERILEVETEGNVLIFELFSKGNAIFCDNDRTILMPLEAQTWKSRKIASKLQYQYPPPVKNPFGMELSEFQKAVTESEKGLAAFLATGMNLSGKYAEEACARAEIDKGRKCSDISVAESKKLFDSIHELPKGFRPNIVLENGKAADFAPVELQIYKSSEKKYFSEFSPALDEFFTALEKGDVAAVSEEEGRYARIIETQKADLEKWGEKEKGNMQKGEFVNGNIGQVQEIIDAINEGRGAKKSWDEIKSGIAGRAGDISVSRILEKEGFAVVENDIQINFRKSARENARNFFEAAKQARRKKEAAEISMKKMEAELGTAAKEKPKEKKIAHGNGVSGGAENRRFSCMMRKRKEQKYYEKFRWFFTKDGFLVIGGKDASQNEMIFKRHIEKGDVVLHAEIHGAPLTVIKSEGKKISEEAIKEAAEFAAAYSSAWKRRLGSADVYWINPEQVSKTPPSGTSLAKGAFMIYGRKNYVRNISLKIAIGIDFGQDAEGSRFAYPVCGTVSGISARAKYFVTIIPGAKPHGELAKQISAKIITKTSPEDRPFIEAIPADDFGRFLPAGNGDVVG
ncbi:MAG: ribosome rescue protein RqcH [Candidatus Aenigmatarchaeota archaeon]